MNPSPSLRRTSPSARRNQAGVSLIELMVGITIGLLVVVAAVGSLMYTRVSSTTVGDSSRLQQDAATAFRIIGHHVRQAGARRIQNVSATNPNVQFNPAYSGFGTTTTTVVLSGAEGASGATDTLRVSHDADPTIGVSDCLGQVPSTANVTNTFTLVGGELRCLGSATGSTTQAIIAGVEDFQVWYGVRTGLGVNSTLQYANASSVTWDRIETVMVCLRLAGDLSNNPGVDVTGCNGETISADGRIRRVFRRVYFMRNLGL